MINETERSAAAAPPLLPALLARLEAERAHHKSCAALSRVDECRIAHSSIAAGLHIAAIRLVEEAEGRKAAGEYMQRTSAGGSSPLPVSTAPGERAPKGEDFLVAIEGALESHLLPVGVQLLDDTRSAVMRALLPLVEQLRADRDRIADDFRRWMGRLSQKVLDERKRADAAEAATRRVLEQRQELAAERYAWQERGDRAEAAVARVRALRQQARTEAPDAQGPTWEALDIALDGTPDEATQEVS